MTPFQIVLDVKSSGNLTPEEIKAELLMAESRLNSFSKMRFKLNDESVKALDLPDAEKPLFKFCKICKKQTFQVKGTCVVCKGIKPEEAKAEDVAKK